MKRLGLAALVLLAAGCSGDTLDGEVTYKGVEAGYTYVQTQTTCSGSNPPICNSYPIIISVPPCYELVVTTKSGEIDSGCVDKVRWNNVEVGEHYTGEDVELEETEMNR